MIEAAARALLVVAHPGHELRVYDWLREAKPRLLVITDGSGRGARSRVPDTAALIAGAGAEAGAMFPYGSDRALYDALLRRDVAYARGIVDAIVAEALASRATLVAGDALEGFNPAHDLCRYCIDVAVVRLRAEYGVQLGNFEFALDGPPPGPEAQAGAIVRHVRGDALARKLDAVLRYESLAFDREQLRARYGDALFEREALQPAVAGRGVRVPPGDPPFYERAGERRREEGEYAEVIRYREHVQPLVHALWRGYGLPLPA